MKKKKAHSLFYAQTMLGEWQLRRFHAMKSLLFESSEQKMTVLEKKKKEKKKKEKKFFW